MKSKVGTNIVSVSQKGNIEQAPAMRRPWQAAPEGRRYNPKRRIVMKRCVYHMSLLFVVLSFTGCTSTPTVTTRSYALVNLETEKALINKIVIDDEIARLGIDKYPTASGGKYRPVETTDENTVIVRTTAYAHAAIRKALDESRKDIANVKENYNK
jgi:hypothetical protein